MEVRRDPSDQRLSTPAPITAALPRTRPACTPDRDRLDTSGKFSIYSVGGGNVNSKQMSICLLGGCLLTLSCATRSDLTAVSSKNVNLSSVRIDQSKAKGRVSGEDCQHIISFIPTSGAPTLDEALDRALESRQANLLLDAVVDFSWFYIPYIYGKTCWRAEGDAYDTYQ